MRHLDAPRLLLVSALALAATQALAIDSPTPSSNGAPGAGSCVIVDYTVKAGDGYTWYYCPSSRVFIRPGQRWVTNLDKGVETGILEQERKVRTQPLSVKHEQQRAATGRDSAPSFTATGKTDVIAGVTAEEHIVKVNFRGQPSEVHQWFAKDLRTPGQEKAMAWVIDKDTARKVPPGVFLRDDDREATGVRKGEPPAAVLAIPADYEKQHWSKEKNGWVDGE